MTKMVRWVPNLNELRREMPALRPALDIIEEENRVLVNVELPGLAANDVDVQVDGDLLTISGEFGSTEEEEGTRYHYRERRQGAFKRSLRLAENLDTGNIEATFEQGVLRLAISRLPEAQPRRIKIEMA